MRKPREVPREGSRACSTEGHRAGDLGDEQEVKVLSSQRPRGK